MVWNYLRKAFKDIQADVHIGPNPPAGQYIELWWGNPAKWDWANGAVKVGMALSEARSLPFMEKEKSLSNLAMCDLLVCPSKAASLAFYESSLDLPIEVVYFGIEPDEMKFVDRSFKGKIRFLLAGAAQVRKGTGIGIEAFLQAFSWRHSAELIIWSSTKTPDREIFKKEYGHIKNIKFDDRVLDSAFEMYKECDVLLSPHLSEGFGLQPLEAMATGMPCIISKCSAPREYSSSEFVYFIDMSDDYVPISNCLKDTGGTWRIPSVDSLVEKMRHVYKRRNEAKSKGEAAAEYVRSKFCWSHTAQRIVKLMEEYFGEAKLNSNNALTQRREVVAILPEKIRAAD